VVRCVSVKQHAYCLDWPSARTLHLQAAPAGEPPARWRLWLPAARATSSGAGSRRSDVDCLHRCADLPPGTGLGDRRAVRAVRRAAADTVDAVLEGLSHVYQAVGLVRLHTDPVEYALIAFNGRDGGRDISFTEATRSVTAYPASRGLARTRRSTG